MRWELSAEQKMFGAALATWLERTAPSATVRELLDSGDPTAFERAFADEGWLAVGFPEDWGGQGGGLLEQALMAEQLARFAAPSSAWLATALALPAAPQLAEQVLAGRCVALAADANRPLDAAVPVTAVLGRLSGRVANVLGGDRASYFVVPGLGDGGLALYLVDAADARVAPRTLLDRTRSTADLVLGDVAATRLGVDAELFLAEAALRAAVLVAADSLGAAERMLELAVEYSKQRQQFGVPIGSFQAVKHTAAQMTVGVEASRSIAYYAAATVEAAHPECHLHAAAAKAQVTAAGEHAADSSLTLHGAIGYTWEHDLHLYYKRAKLDHALFGGPSVWNERIAAALPLATTG